MEQLIKLNKKFLWDYKLSEEDLKREVVFVFYLSRLLNNANFRFRFCCDIKMGSQPQPMHQCPELLRGIYLSFHTVTLEK